MWNSNRKVAAAAARSTKELLSVNCTSGGVMIAVKKDAATVVDTGGGRVESILEKAKSNCPSLREGRRKLTHP